MQIDQTSYRKDTMHPPRYGYQARGGAVPLSVIIHTTNNRNKNTAFTKEAEFIRDSPDISAHFLIGKDGRIVQFLDPVRWQAWHAGNALPLYLNARSIGIEHHVSLGETWTGAQHDACTWLVRSLMASYGIPPALVDTHRSVALPKGRKRDPEGWQDTAFYAWRSQLLAAPPPAAPPRYKALGVPVYQQSTRTGPLWGHLSNDEVVEIDDMSNGHLADGRGFVRLNDDTMEPLP